MKVRLATPADVNAVVSMRRERVAWLSDCKGSDQWSFGLTEAGFESRVHASVGSGETWVAVTDDDRVVGTIAVDQWTNPGLWSEQECGDAVMVHRMVTPLAHAGRGIGRLLLGQADRIALAAGRKWLRLDAWTSNRGLHEYYESTGFRHVRTVNDHPTSDSTALFERPASLTLPSVRELPMFVPDVADNPAPPEHWHTVCGIKVSRPPLLGERGDIAVSDGAWWHLWWQAKAWRMSPAGHGGKNANRAHRSGANSVCTVTEWIGRPELSDSREYRILHSAACTAELRIT